MLSAGMVNGAWESVYPILDEYYQNNGEFLVNGIEYSEMRKKITGFLSIISESAMRINHIVKELKRFVRQDNEGMKSKVDVNLIIKKAVVLIQNYIKKSTNYFHVDLDQDLPYVKGHFQQIEQVIVNLIQNACQALTNKDERISVRTQYDRECRCIVIEVEDEGIGIPKEHLKYISDPFFTTKRSSGGTGLGLSVSSTIIQEHEGTLDFVTQQGKGTKAKVVLPVFNTMEIEKEPENEKCISNSSSPPDR
jgi:C4-dicarboxylate-specific signal transduction histidine kinase